MINAPTVKENKTELAMISHEDIFISSKTKSISIHTKAKGTYSGLLELYTEDTDLLDKLENFLKQNGKARIQAKYEQSNKETYKTLIKLDVLTSNGYVDVKTL